MPICPTELSEIATDDKVGRECDEEFCCYKPLGIDAPDLAITVKVYRKALAEGLGTTLDY